MKRHHWERYTGLPTEPSYEDELKEMREDRENRQHLIDTLRALGLYNRQPSALPDRFVIGSTSEGTSLVVTVGHTSEIWWSPVPIRHIYPTPTLTVETSVFEDGKHTVHAEPLQLFTDRAILEFRDLIDLRELCSKLSVQEPTPEPELPVYPSSLPSQ